MVKRKALAVATLGTERDAQIIDELTGERQDHFLFHYNFPPYSVGETGMIGSPKRREIGHGRLAKPVSCGYAKPCRIPVCGACCV